MTAIQVDKDSYNQSLLEFIRTSPTPFHATANMAALLDEHGFQCLRGDDAWQLAPGQAYYTLRNGSSLIAFIYGSGDIVETGIRMVGAHTDSPCLRVKPNPEIKQQGYLQLGVEVYGGVLLNPWFDRDLSLAGRVTCRTEAGELKNLLIDFVKPLAVVPSLAIHLDREANDGRKINAQKEIPPILLALKPEEEINFNDLLLQQIKEQHPQESIAAILESELSFYDTQSPAIVGLRNEFITGARLDNLASCHIGLHALLQSKNEANSQASRLLICNDHEEVGSQSASGAQGPMLHDFLARLLPNVEQRARVLERSMLISADNAHGVHPNFSDKHDSNHGPILNRGPVIKINANQRYASNSETSAVFRHICDLGDLPVQSFVSRSDMACGSTIGPLTAAEVGVRTLDVGIPTFAMHSIREMGGSEDPYILLQALLRFQGLDQLGC